MIPHSKPWIDHTDKVAVAAQLSSGMIAHGEAAERFELALGRRCGAARAITTASGTAALALCLATLNVGHGDEVILPSYLCQSVLDAVREAGAQPVLCDSGPLWNATADTISARITPRTRAIIAVNIFGISARLSALAQSRCAVIEDHAQSFGLPEPLYGAAAFFSFHATKCLTTGAGGAAIVRKPMATGTMSDLQAALGLSQLARYEAMLARRRQIAERYFAELPSRLTEALGTVREQSIFYRFPLRMRGDFAAIQAQYAARGVAVRRGVDALLHRVMDRPDKDFPNAVAAYDSTVSIPIYPVMSDDEVGRVIDTVKAVMTQ